MRKVAAARLVWVADECLPQPAFAPSILLPTRPTRSLFGVFTHDFCTRICTYPSKNVALCSLRA
jgi:hypothetical protein